MLREKIGENIWFNSEQDSKQDSKFKTNSVSVNFIMPLDKKTVTQNALIAYLLRMGSKKYKHIVDLNKELSYLYGVSLSSNVGKIGSYQILEFRINYIDDEYTMHGDSILEKCIDLLISVLMDPDLENDVSCNKKIEIAKQLLTDKIDSGINDKRRYAIDKCTEIMFSLHPFSIDKYGYKCDIENIDREKIVDAYQKIISEARIEIISIGKSDDAIVANMFKNAFEKIKRNSDLKISFPAPVIDRSVKKVEENFEVSQSKMVMGFCVNEENMDRDKYRLVSVINTLYGGDVFSKLFSNVREKMSLCYYCVSRFEKSVRSIFVDCGIHSENGEKVQAAILEQLDEIKKGNITQHELDMTISAMVNQLKSVEDSLESMESWYFRNVIWNLQSNVDQEIEAIKKVTIKELVDLAKKIELNTVYFLKGFSDDELN